MEINDIKKNRIGVKSEDDVIFDKSQLGGDVLQAFSQEELCKYWQEGRSG